MLRHVGPTSVGAVLTGGLLLASGSLRAEETSE
jgi:hypothetical protein